MECKTNYDFREMLNKLKDRIRNFATLSQVEQFVYIFTNEDNMSLIWLGKLIHKFFSDRIVFSASSQNMYMSWWLY